MSAQLYYCPIINDCIVNTFEYSVVAFLIVNWKLLKFLTRLGNRIQIKHIN